MVRRLADSQLVHPELLQCNLETLQQVPTSSFIRCPTAEIASQRAPQQCTKLPQTVDPEFAQSHTHRVAGTEDGYPLFCSCVSCVRTAAIACWTCMVAHDRPLLPVARRCPRSAPRPSARATPSARAQATATVTRTTPTKTRNRPLNRAALASSPGPRPSPPPPPLVRAAMGLRRRSGRGSPTRTLPQAPRRASGAAPALRRT
jgi:hypothetical protein